MAKRKRAEPEIIRDLSSHLEFRTIRILQDGKSKKPDVFLVEIRRPTEKTAPTGRRKKGQLDSGVCVLKIVGRRSVLYQAQARLTCQFNHVKQQEELYETELKANIRLTDALPTETSFDATQTALKTISEPPSRQWPQCIGRVVANFGTGVGPNKWTPFLTNTDGSKPRNGLLFEYIPDLKYLTPDLLDDAVAQDILRVLGDIHARNVLHRDHVQHGAWPEIRFNNIFVQRDAETRDKRVFILDFNCALTLTGGKQGEQCMLDAEMDRMQDLLDRAMSGRQWVDHVPKEVQRLLA
ncbi:hypothetical protein OQA88_5520 [Cercophora sp. LCS_1]